MSGGRQIRAMIGVLLVTLSACSGSSDGAQVSAGCIENTSVLSVDNESKQDATISVQLAFTQAPAKAFLAPAGTTTQITVPAGSEIIAASLVGDAIGSFQKEQVELACGALHHFSIEPHPDALVVVQRAP